MAKAAAASVVDSIAGAIPDTTTGPRKWWERADAIHADVLTAIDVAWREGRFGRKKYPAARAISAKLAELGIATVGPQGVIAWLDRPAS